jgi:hypothetical protein
MITEYFRAHLTLIFRDHGKAGEPAPGGAATFFASLAP